VCTPSRAPPTKALFNKKVKVRTSLVVFIEMLLKPSRISEQEVVTKLRMRIWCGEHNLSIKFGPLVN